MPMNAVGSLAPVGAMMVVSPEDRKLAGRLTTWATKPNTSEISTMIPSAGQNRPRVSVQERAIAPPSVACSRMIAAGASSSLIMSHRVSGIAARITRTVRPTAASGAARPIATRAATTSATSRKAARARRKL